MLSTDEFASKMIVKAEMLSGDDSKPLVITLPLGTKVIGYSLGIETEEDDDENEYEVLAFNCPDLHRIFWFRDEQIIDVQLA